MSDFIFSEEIKKEIINEEIHYEEKFKMITTFSQMLKKGYINSILIYGTSGIGKDYAVEEVLKDDAFYIRGGLKGTFELVKVLYQHRKDEILVFSDCDSIFKNFEQKNILKTALEDRYERYISYFDSSTKSKKDKIPDRFTFTSGLIVISNRKSFDSAYRSRSATIKIIMNNEEKLERINTYLDPFLPEIPIKYKKKVMDYIVSIEKTIKNIDFRLFKHCLATYLSYLDDNSISWKKWIKVLLCS